MMKEYEVKLYRGYPETSGDTLKQMLEKGLLELVPAKENGHFDLLSGIYSVHITGKRIHPTLKIMCIKEDEMDVDMKLKVKKDIVPVSMIGDLPEGYQPTVMVADVPKYFKRTQKDELLCIWPDEILDIYGDGRVPEHHQCMTHREVESMIMSLNQDFLKTYCVGKTQHYGFSIPLVVLSKDTLDDTIWEDALNRLKDSEKVNILYQAQIHGNEPAACDGAMAVLADFCENDKLQRLLDYVNLIIIPRVNPEAAYLYRRMTYDNIDLNRDHMAGNAYETRLMHRVFQILEPEVVLDGHEFTFFVTETENNKGYVAKGCEVMSSPATSLNIDQFVREESYAICGQVFQEMKANGYRVYHFGTAEQASLGRGFYGLNQCLSFLIETRGIGGGRYGYEKRVIAQKDIMLSYIKSIALSGKKIKETVKRARKKYADIDKLVLQHGCSNHKFTAYKGICEQYYLDGSLRQRIEEGLCLQDLGLRTRETAKAYVMAADAEEIDQIVEKVKYLGCEVKPVDAGTVLSVKPYRYIGLREENVQEKDIIAEILPVEKVVFEKGGYFFTAQDFRRVLLAMLLEPDVTDTVGTKATLFQQGLMEYEKETGRFPLYRMD